MFVLFVFPCFSNYLNNICIIFVSRAVCCVIIFGRDVYPIEESLNNRAGVIRTDRGGAAEIEDKLFDPGMRGGEQSCKK